MCDGMKLAFAAAAKTRPLTPMQQRVFDVLTDVSVSPYVIADRAKIRTISPKETASKYCIQLVKIGLAERTGSAMYPSWRRAKGETP